MTESSQNAQRKRAWRKQAPSYDRLIGWWERRFFGEDNRPWACSRAEGRVLEVAVGTGLNLPFYDAGLDVVGIDLSPDMLAIARRRALEAGQDVDLREGDAHDLDFEDASFDSVVCTFSLCNIPDVDQALERDAPGPAARRHADPRRPHPQLGASRSSGCRRSPSW